jgi:hypothetical protein
MCNLVNLTAVFSPLSSDFLEQDAEVTAAAGYKNCDDTSAPTYVEVLWKIRVVSPMCCQDDTP